MAQITQEAAPGPAARQPAPGGERGADRRERKKRRTRDALIQAAMELFDRKGYEQTAVHEITDAVDVSERTFFRYFASKEDLVISFVTDRMSAFAQALADRPPQEDPLTAARNAFHVSHRQLSADGGTPSYHSVIRLIDTSPALLAAHLRVFHERDDEITRVIAEREGVDPVTDRRPKVVTAMIGALVVLASREWDESGSEDPADMATAFDAYADEIVPALTGRWRTR